MTRPETPFPVTPLWILSPTLERLVVTLGIVGVLVAEQVDDTVADVREVAWKLSELATGLRVWWRGDEG